MGKYKFVPPSGREHAPTSSGQKSSRVGGVHSPGAAPTKGTAKPATSGAPKRLFRKTA
jgi:hypothetical protein